MLAEGQSCHNNALVYVELSVLIRENFPFRKILVLLGTRVHQSQCRSHHTVFQIRDKVTLWQLWFFLFRIIPIQCLKIYYLIKHRRSPRHESLSCITLISHISMTMPQYGNFKFSCPGHNVSIPRNCRKYWQYLRGLSCIYSGYLRCLISTSLISTWAYSCNKFIQYRFVHSRDDNYIYNAYFVCCTIIKIVVYTIKVRIYYSVCAIEGRHCFRHVFFRESRQGCIVKRRRLKIDAKDTVRIGSVTYNHLTEIRFFF